MSKPDSRLVFLILILGLLTVFWSCAQTDDITASKSMTNMWLSAERLPSLPAGMVYELWVAKNPVTDTAMPSNELVSVGRFLHINNDTINAFLEPDGTLRADSNLFVLSSDVFDYSGIFVSVELLNDTEPDRPGPIMLVKPISGRPIDSVMRLNFPLNGEDGLWGSICRYSMEGVTDGQRFSNDGCGVWFCDYAWLQRSIPDTNGATWTYELDTIIPEIDSLTGDTLNLDSLRGPHRDSVSFDVVSWRVDFGVDSLTLDIDSFVHTGLVITQYFELDTIPPFTGKDQTIEFDTTPRQVILDVFSQDNFGMPDYSDWGWKWQGWIVSNYIYPDTALGSFTPPPWDYEPGTPGNGIIPGNRGGLLTTGKFSRIDQPDDSDPYTNRIIARIVGNDTTYKRPNYPGEDFLNSAALQAAGITNGSPLQLLPANNGSTYGSVFITLEPANDVLDSTNFPLIAFVRSFPISWPANAGSNSTNAFMPMLNTTGSVPGTAGFPEIKVKVQRL